MSFAPVGCAMPAMAGVGVGATVGLAPGVPPGEAAGVTDGVAPAEQAAVLTANRRTAAGSRVRFDMRPGTPFDTAGFPPGKLIAQGCLTGARIVRASSPLGS